MKDFQQAPRQDPDKVLIDRYIDWRCANKPQDTSPIKTNLSAETLYYALGIPAPQDDEEEYADSVFYRGFQVLAKIKK
jgi:hypothetical protein